MSDREPSAPAAARLDEPEADAAQAADDEVTVVATQADLPPHAVQAATQAAAQASAPHAGPTAAQPAPAPPGPVPAGPVPLGPYRAPPSAEASTVQRAPRPVLGPALGVFGALLWAFVVAGQFTTSWWFFGAPLGQRTAVTLVVAVTFAAWITGVRRSRLALAPRSGAVLVGRALAIGALAIVLFEVVLLAAIVLGRAIAGGQDRLVAVLLTGVAATAQIVGSKLTTPTPPARTHGARVARVLLWCAASLVTLAAGADLIASG